MNKMSMFKSKHNQNYVFLDLGSNMAPQGTTSHFMVPECLIIDRVPTLVPTP